MNIQRTRLGFGLVLAFALIALGPLLSGSRSGLAYADYEQTMSPSQWQALSETVALNLAREGIPTEYIPALTAVVQQALAAAESGSDVVRDSIRSHENYRLGNQILGNQARGWW
jgi:hypothetical protein